MDDRLKFVLLIMSLVRRVSGQAELAILEQLRDSCRYLDMLEASVVSHFFCAYQSVRSDCKVGGLTAPSASFLISHVPSFPHCELLDSRKHVQLQAQSPRKDSPEARVPGTPHRSQRPLARIEGGQPAHRKGRRVSPASSTQRISHQCLSLKSSSHPPQQHHPSPSSSLCPSSAYSDLSSSDSASPLYKPPHTAQRTLQYHPDGR